MITKLNGSTIWWSKYVGYSWGYMTNQNMDGLRSIKWLATTFIKWSQNMMDQCLLKYRNLKEMDYILICRWNLIDHWQVENKQMIKSQVYLYIYIGLIINKY